MIVQPSSEHVEECIKLTVHGVTEPSDEIKKDLVNVLQKCLDDYTLEMLTMALARNPNTKLALQDVEVTWKITRLNFVVVASTCYPTNSIIIKMHLYGAPLICL